MHCEKRKNKKIGIYIRSFFFHLFNRKHQDTYFPSIINKSISCVYYIHINLCISFQPSLEKICFKNKR